MSDTQNPPLPDPGPGDGAHEGDDWEVGGYDLPTPDAETAPGEAAVIENQTEKTDLEQK